MTLTDAGLKVSVIQDSIKESENAKLVIKIDETMIKTKNNPVILRVSKFFI